MIDRYCRPEMAGVWSEQTKFANWLEIEILATEARVGRGEVPAADLRQIREKAAFDPERIKVIERKTRHDVAAFLDNLAENIGPAARHLHYGMTSSDVLDTGLSLQLRSAAQLLLKATTRLIEVCILRARQTASMVLAARTHGVHAEPSTFGLKVTGWAFELSRGRARLEAAKKAVSVGKLSGAVGTYSQLPPAVERYVCEKLGLVPDPSSTQVISRDRHAEFVSALAILAGTLDRIATEIRHLARTEVAEVAEPFAEGEQKGSSAMPHKRNPWRSERLTGLARIVRAASVAANEDIALWHERDISHSSVERVLLPDACLALDFMLAEAEELISGLVLMPEAMRRNMDLSFGLLFSQNLLLKLIDKGLVRDEAYRLVQEAAAKASNNRMHLKQVSAEHPEISSRLSAEEIEACFSEDRYIEHAAEIIGRLDALVTS
ncbi:MAG: adenylosuccinate lyase [Actinomycetota bacterium]